MPTPSYNPLLLIGFGLFVGVFSGLMGLGGGAVMIPLMVLALGFDQAKAHGMSLLVMIPPVTLPAVVGYWQRGHIDSKDIWLAAMIAVGFAGGSYFGSQLADFFASQKGMLKLVFGFLLVYVAGYTIFSYFGERHILRTVILAGVLALVAVGLFWGCRWVDRGAGDGSVAVAAPAQEKGPGI